MCTDIYDDEEERRKPVCGCNNPYCILPVNDWEDEEGNRVIADTCETKNDDRGKRIRQQIYNSMTLIS